MTEEDFTRLGAHLEQLQPIVEKFCQRHCFEQIMGSSIGRYPRIRLQRCDEISLWIDLWMGLDSEGRRFSLFSPDVPYELSAGAFFEDASGGGDKWRCQKSIVIWPAKPFKEVAHELPEALEAAVTLLLKWNLELIRKEGLRIQLG